MSEARMAQQMRVSRGEFRHSAVTIDAGATVVPCAGQAETVPITLAPFKDHGRPAFVASTISSRKVLQQTAGSLDRDQSRRLNGVLTRAMEGLLEEGIVRSDGVLRSDIQGKPDIHVVTLGDPFKDSSLRLYFHLGEYQTIDQSGRLVKAAVVFQDARTTKKDSDKVERVLRQEGGYRAQWGWDNVKRS